MFLEPLTEISHEVSSDEETTLTDVQVSVSQTLKLIFRCCDVSGKGLISSVELKTVCVNYPEVAAFIGINRENKVNVVFEKLDKQSKGGVDRDDFLSHIATHRGNVCTENAASLLTTETKNRMLFDLVDVNKDGRITFFEFADACEHDTSILGFLFPPTGPGKRNAPKLRLVLKSIRRDKTSKAATQTASFEDFCLFMELLTVGGDEATSARSFFFQHYQTFLKTVGLL